MRRIYKIIISIVVAIAVLVGGCGIYFGSYYRASDEAVSALLSSSGVVTEYEGENLVFKPANAEVGFIFYPGGNVEYTSYAPLMQALAEKGIMCVLVKMPFNHAVFDVNAADGIKEKFPEIKSWYIGGHSLGGAMAGSYLEENHKAFDGLILLASYSASDLSKTDLKVLSIYGSNDEVFNMESYNKYLSNLPKNTNELVIDGGCHSQFGSYGKQKGDGEPTITGEEQIKQTTEFILQNING